MARALLFAMVVAWCVGGCDSAPTQCRPGDPSCPPGQSCVGAACQPVPIDMSTAPDLAPRVHDVGVSPGMAFAVEAVFGGGEQETPSLLCQLLGTGFRVAASSTGIDVAKLDVTPGFYFAAAYGTLNNANQLVSCTSSFGEPAIFGGGAWKSEGGDDGLKRAQPSPCFGFTRFYACQSGSVQCGAGPNLETTNSQVAGWGVLCVK